MKKITKLSSILCLSLAFFAVSPSNQDADYQDLSNDEFSLTMKQYGSFVEAQTTHSTPSRTVYNKRYKTWTEFTAQKEISGIEGILEKY